MMDMTLRTIDARVFKDKRPFVFNQQDKEMDWLSCALYHKQVVK